MGTISSSEMEIIEKWYREKVERIKTEDNFVRDALIASIFSLTDFQKIDLYVKYTDKSEREI